MIDTVINMKRTCGLDIVAYRTYRIEWQKRQHKSTDGGYRGGNGTMAAKITEVKDGLTPTNVWMAKDYD